MMPNTLDASSILGTSSINDVTKIHSFEKGISDQDAVGGPPKLLHIKPLVNSA